MVFAVTFKMPLLTNEWNFIVSYATDQFNNRTHDFSPLEIFQNYIPKELRSPPGDRQGYCSADYVRSLFLSGFVCFRSRCCNGTGAHVLWYACALKMHKCSSETHQIRSKRNAVTNIGSVFVCNIKFAKRIASCGSWHTEWVWAWALALALAF